ncbi:MAG: hypothetical protein ABWK05_00370 [Pyrobaculum sp.]
MLEEIRGKKKVHGKRAKSSHWLAAVAVTFFGVFGRIRPGHRSLAEFDTP